MLSDQDLVARLRQYDFSRFVPASPRGDPSGVFRPHGFGNTIAQIKNGVELMPDRKYDQNIADIIYRAYGFCRVSYDAINFTELRDHRSEPAVDLLFCTDALLRELGSALHEFLTAASTGALGDRYRVTKETPSYAVVMRTLEAIRELDKNNFYKKRVAELEEKLYGSAAKPSQPPV